MNTENSNTENSLRLSCPKCNALVRVAAKLSGKKIKCPKCAAVIKVPGTDGTDRDDDQWLSLDEPLTLPRSQSASQSKSGPSAESPSAESPSADWLDDLPPLVSVDPRKPAHAGGGLPPLSDADLKALNAAGGDLVLDTPPAPKVLTTADVVTGTDTVSEYRAKCPVCESIHHVKPAQAGRQISCGDCLSKFVVPPPPKPVVKRKMDLTKAASFGLSQVDARQADYGGPGARSAADYLRAAEDADDDQEDPHHQYENPDIKAWLGSMFGVFLDPSVIGFWLALSFLGAVPSVVVLAIGSPILVIGWMVGVPFYLIMVVICAFAIMESNSAGQKTVSEWPTFDPGDWFGQCLYAVVALAASAFPGIFLGYFVFGLTFATLAMVLVSIFVMFPFVILSMMDNGSVMMPVSAEVTKSVTRCKEQWGTLYFSSLLLFFGYYFLLAMLSLLPAVVALFFGCFLTVGLIFVYFSIVGGLAFQLGQAITRAEDSLDR